MEVSQPPFGRQGLRTLAAIAAVAMLLVTAAIMHAHKKALPAPVAASAPTPPAPTPVAAATSLSPPAPATDEPEASDADKNPAARREFFKNIREPYLVPYDYDGLLQAIQTGKVKPDVANPVQFHKAIEHLSEMKAWFLERLSHYTATQPLTVPRFGLNGEKDYKIYGAPPKNIVIISNGIPTSMNLANVKPPFLSLILLAAIKNNPGVPGDVILGASAFGRFYNLPEMEAELQPLGGAKRPAAKP